MLSSHTILFVVEVIAEPRKFCFEVTETRLQKFDQINFCNIIKAFKKAGYRCNHVQLLLKKSFVTRCNILNSMALFSIVVLFKFKLLAMSE